MEHCSYGSVADMMDILGEELEEDVIAQIVSDALHGLQYLHELHKIHRDIKPANFLMTREGNVKLGDFGIATTMDGKNKHHKTLVGTPYFLAPEIVEENGYNEKVDIWALGISIIEMAEMFPPYYDMHPMRVLMLISQNPPPKLKNENEHSYSLQQFLNSCLIKLSTSRPSAYSLLKHPFVAMRNKQSLMTLLDRLSEKIQENGGIEKTLDLVKKQKKEPTFAKPDGIDERNDNQDETGINDLEDIIDNIVKKCDVSDSIDYGSMAKQSTNTTDEIDVMNIYQNIIDTGDINQVEDKEEPFRFSPIPAHNAISVHSVNTNNTLFQEQIGMKEKQKEKKSIYHGVSPLENEQRMDNMRSPVTPIFTDTHMNQPFVPIRRTSSREDGKAIRIKSNCETMFEIFENGDNEVYRLDSEWKGITAGGCHAFPTWRNNTQLSLHIFSKTQIRMSLEQIAEEGNITHIAMYIFKAKETEDRVRMLELDEENIFGQGATFSLKRKIEQTIEFEPGWYVIFGCTYQPSIERRYIMELEYQENSTEIKIKLIN